MKLLKSIFRKLQRKSTPCVRVNTVAGIGVPATDEAMSVADVLNRNIAFAISYAATLQGVSFLQEETSAIQEIVNRAVVRKLSPEEFWFIRHFEWYGNHVEQTTLI